MEDYRTIRGTAIGEYEEKKSRFIAQLSFADSEEKAVAFLEQVRAANRTARHNVYAYRLREGSRERYSDDGEPAKTAGTPALEVLQHSGLTDLIVVITRYFGGVLLGTGGLVRAYTTATSRALEAAEVVQEVFSNTCMRVYTNTDIKGVELSGAMKNVIALGVGISTGLGYGDNARAALITRGIAEIARLGVAMGCNVQTFAGLAGIGDLIVTATSMHSRNNRAGILIGKGESPEQAVKEVGMVVEGINALPAAMELAEKYHVEMPIAQTVNAIVKEGMSASDALRNLMSRDRKSEMPQGYESV